MKTSVFQSIVDGIDHSDSRFFGYVFRNLHTISRNRPQKDAMLFAEKALCTPLKHFHLHKVSYMKSGVLDLDISTAPILDEKTVPIKCRILKGPIMEMGRWTFDYDDAVKPLKNLCKVFKEDGKRLHLRGYGLEWREDIEFIQALLVQLAVHPHRDWIAARFNAKNIDGLFCSCGDVNWGNHCHYAESLST